MEEVYSFLKENINQDEYIVIGVSGGVDSMMLLYVLRQFSNNIVCAHIHHNLRVESDEEELFVKDYCSKHGIIFETTKLEYEDKFSESVAREKRYSFFEEVLNKYGSKTLFTAHHGDDLIETVLMKIVRGSTIKGYSGIELISHRETYRVYRPLLYLSKEAIYEYAESNEIPYREDKTNEENQYTRNRYRKYVLPFLKEENQDVHLKFLNYSENLLDYYHYVDEHIPNEINDLEEFRKLDIFIQKEMLKKHLFNVYEDNIDKISGVHIQNMVNLINNGENNSSIDLPDGYKASIEYNTFKMEKASLVAGYSFIFDKKIELSNGKVIEEIEETEETTNFVTYLDSSELELPMTVRTLQGGDRMTVKNMDGHKKISDIFTDEKIRLNERNLWPIVTDNKGEVIWLPGLKKSHFDRKKTEKYDIILRYY